MSETNFSQIPGTTGQYLSNLELEIVSPNTKKIKSALTMRNKSIEWQINFLKKKLKFWKKILESTVTDLVLHVTDPVLRAKITKKFEAQQEKARGKVPEIENMIAALQPQVKEELFTETAPNTLVVPPGLWFVCDSIHDNLHLNTDLKPFYLPECRPYQCEGLGALYQYNRGTLELATGLGKSLIIQSLALSSVNSGMRVMIVVPTEYLVGQMYKEMKALHANTTAVGGGRQPELGWDILVTTIQSAQGFADLPQVVLMDECFPYEQCIVTENGPIEIGKLHAMRVNEKILPKVMSFNEKLKTFELKDITFSWKQKDTTENLINIKTSRLSIKCTNNHLLLTNNGWITAENIKIGDFLTGNKGTSDRAQLGGIVWNNDQYQILLGSFLGDGHLQKNTNNPYRYRLRVIHGMQQKDYCQWKADMMGAKTEIVKKNGYKKNSAIRFTSKCFDSLIEIPKNKNYCPQKIIDDLDEKGLAIWFMDDGSSTQNGNATLHTCSFDEDSCIRLAKKLNHMGVECKTVFRKYKGKRAPGYWEISITNQGFRNLVLIIKPYMHPALFYKIRQTPEKLYSWDSKPQNIRTYPVKTITKTSNKKNKGQGFGLFDLEIKDNHNFVVCGGTSRKGSQNDGIVAHNCHHAPAETWTKLMCQTEKTTHVYGFTATANRADGLDMAIHSFAGPVVYSRDVQWGIQNGWLSNFSAFSIEVHPRYHGGPKDGRPIILSDNIQGTTAYKILGSSFEVFQVARDKLMICLERGRKPIVIFKTVEACKKFRKFCEPIIKLDVASAQEGKKSKYPLRMFQENKAPYLLANSGLISEGIDFPYADTLIQCVQNSSDVMSLQILGRVLRKPEGKRDAVVIDIYPTGFVQFIRAGERRRELYAKIIGENNVKKVVL